MVCMFARTALTYEHTGTQSLGVAHLLCAMATAGVFFSLNCWIQCGTLFQVDTFITRLVWQGVTVEINKADFKQSI